MSPNHPIVAPAQDPLANLHRALQRSGAQLPDLYRTARMLRDHPAWLAQSLRLLRLNDGALAQVAGRSYSHPNGFAKIVLYIGDGYAVRLHVWDRPGRRWQSETKPHGHRWEFASWIVTGTLRETTFAETARGRPYSRYEYRRDRNGVGRLTPNGTARLRVVDHIDRPADSVYQCSRTVVHTVAPMGRDLVASLVLQGPRSLGPTPVYQRPNLNADDEEQQLRPVQLRELMADVAVALYSRIRA